MATFELRVSAQLIIDDGGSPDSDGKIGAITVENSACTSSWRVSVKTQSQCWVEWATGSSSITVEKITGNLVATNGEILTDSITDYLITISAYESFDTIQNTEEDSITFTLLEEEGGTELDLATYSKWNTGVQC